MILEKTNVAKEVSSIWTTEATISSTTFVGMHHLLIIDFYLHNENSTVNERLYYDVLVNVTIPPGIYVDPFELEVRNKLNNCISINKHLTSV